MTFSLRDAWSPVPLKIPCGKCIGCQKNKARQWAMRCMHELRMHKNSVFITLTYSDENLPKGGSLCKRDLQLFMKRLRTHLDRTLGLKVRFYACGEYGSSTKRPHYHVLLFGWSPPVGDRKSRSNGKSDNPLYNSATLSSLWDLGHAVCGDVSHASCLYVANYVTKKFVGSDDDTKRHYEVVAKDGEIILREPEFAVMSRRPGLGSTYVKKYADELINHDTVIYDGHELRFPRYYDLQLEKQKLVDQTHVQKIKMSRKRESFRFRADNTKERLHVREHLQLHNLKHHKKDGSI